jgi:ribosomal protein S18 acetylase RimI-like enzyme
LAIAARLCHGAYSADVSLALSSHELIARAHRVASRFHVRTRTAVADLPGNPGQVVVERFGPVWATRCDLPDAPQWMNRVAPLTAADLDALPDVLRWFGTLRPEFETPPLPDHERLALALARCGAVQTGFLDLLRGPLRAGADASSSQGNVAVTPVTHDDAVVFAQTLLHGHVETFYAHEAEGLASMVGGDGLHCYLARVDGEPAAAAILSVDDGLAYLANASTLPAFRGRGCHSALLAARLRAAAQLDCEMSMALADVASSSHRNMERAGLQTLATIAAWTFPAEL